MSVTGGWNVSAFAFQYLLASETMKRHLHLKLNLSSFAFCKRPRHNVKVQRSKLRNPVSYLLEEEEKEKSTEGGPLDLFRHVLMHVRTARRGCSKEAIRQSPQKRFSTLIFIDRYWRITLWYWETRSNKTVKPKWSTDKCLNPHRDCAGQC